MRFKFGEGRRVNESSHRSEYKKPMATNFKPKLEAHRFSRVRDSATRQAFVYRPKARTRPFPTINSEEPILCRWRRALRLAIRGHADAELLAGSRHRKYIQDFTFVDRFGRPSPELHAILQRQLMESDFEVAPQVSEADAVWHPDHEIGNSEQNRS